MLNPESFISSVVDPEIMNRLLGYWTKERFTEIKFETRYSGSKPAQQLVATVSGSNYLEDFIMIRELDLSDIGIKDEKWLRQKYLDFSIEVLENISERMVLKERNRLSTVQHLLLPPQQKP